MPSEGFDYINLREVLAAAREATGATSGGISRSLRSFERPWVGAYGAGLEDGDVRRHEDLELLRGLWSRLDNFCRGQAGVPRAEIFLPTLWLRWIPLARALSALYRSEGRPIVQGIVGAPGAGKTTAAAILGLILEELQRRVLVISLDDLYFPQSVLRRRRARDPKLEWRALPGTHEVALGVELFSKIRSNAPEIDVPRFDKAAHGGMGDRVAFEATHRPMIVLFEGWIVGLRRRHPSQVAALLGGSGSEATGMAVDMNDRLTDYEELWSFLDKLLLLHVPEVDWIRGWRLETEQSRRRAGLGAMSEADTERFIDGLLAAVPPAVHYWPLLEEPGGVDLMTTLDSQRQWA